MTDFFLNVWAWIVSHKTEILTFLTSAEFATLICTFISIIRCNKATKSNTASNSALSNSISKFADLSNSIIAIEKSTAHLADASTTNDAKLDKLSEYYELALYKLNAILDVQSVVYSTLKDTDVRLTVTNILSNAKYAETTQREKLVDELRKLQDEIEKNNLKVATKVNDAVSKVNDIVHVESKTIDPTRY